MAQTPSIPKGTRDYSPEVMVKRNYIFDTIKSVFKLYGYICRWKPGNGKSFHPSWEKIRRGRDKLLFQDSEPEISWPVTNSEVEERNIPPADQQNLREGTTL